MPRAFSADIQTGLMAERTGAILLELLTVSHTDMAIDLRVVNNIEDIMSRGNLFTACGFVLTMPEETERGLRKAKIAISNADQWLTEHIRGLSGEFDVLLERVSATNLAASPPEFDTVEMSFPAFQLTEVSYDAVSIRGTLAWQTIERKQFPAHSFTPAHFPGMF